MTDAEQVVDLDKMERRALVVGTLRREGRLGLDANDALALIAELRQRRVDSERLDWLLKELDGHWLRIHRHPYVDLVRAKFSGTHICDVDSLGTSDAYKDGREAIDAARSRTR